MRPLEAAQLSLIVLAVYLPVVLGRRLRRGWTAPALLAVMTLQLALEGFRWQLIPLETATLGLALGDLAAEERRVSGAQRLRRAALGLVGLGMVAAPPALFPVPRLPPPSGPFAVGTTTLVVVDGDRQDPYAPPPDDDGVTDPRRFVVQVWYPAVVDDDARPLPWNPDLDLVGPALSGRLGLPGFFLSHTAEVKSNSYPGARPLSGRFPVVIYVHGWAGFRTETLNQVESLAGNGYMVIAADHVPAALVSRFPDGEVVDLRPEVLPDPEQVGEEASRKAAELLVETLAGDVESMLEELAAGPSGAFGPLASHADLDSVGIYGTGAGGGAAVRVCLTADICKAVLAFDPWVEPIPGRLLAEELDMPSMFIRSDEWRDTPNDRLLRGLAERSPSESWWLGIDGTTRNDFLIIPVFTPLAHRLGIKGPVPTTEVLRLIDTYLVGFFDRYLYRVGGVDLELPPPEGVELEPIP